MNNLTTVNQQQPTINNQPPPYMQIQYRSPFEQPSNSIPNQQYPIPELVPELVKPRRQHSIPINFGRKNSRVTYPQRFTFNVSEAESSRGQSNSNCLKLVRQSSPNEKRKCQVQSVEIDTDEVPTIKKSQFLGCWSCFNPVTYRPPLR